MDHAAEMIPFRGKPRDNPEIIPFRDNPVPGEARADVHPTRCPDMPWRSKQLSCRWCGDAPYPHAPVMAQKGTPSEAPSSTVRGALSFGPKYWGPIQWCTA